MHGKSLRVLLNRNYSQPKHMPIAGTLISGWLLLVVLFVCGQVRAADGRAKQKTPRIAAIVTEYRHNSHAEMFVSRILQGYTLDGRGEFPNLKLASLYTDLQPKNDSSRELSAKYGFPIYDNVADALTLGTGALAVDGVLLIAEHGSYPLSEIGQKMYPKRRLFGEIAKVFENSGRVVPVFSDKHLAHNWEDAKWIYDTAKRLKIPFMAGSSIPSLWRAPAVDLRRDAKVSELVILSYGNLEAYSFHALEAAQCLVERRHGGETGVESVQWLDGDAVWKAGAAGVYDAELFKTALSRMQRLSPLPDDRLQAKVKQPMLGLIRYRDGLRVNLLVLNGAVADWTAAWRYTDGDIQSTCFDVQYQRPYGHFTHLLKGFERMLQTGRPTWPADRTLLTTGVMHGLFVSRQRGQVLLPTPELQLSYQSDFNWQQPPPMPPPVK